MSQETVSSLLSRTNTHLQERDAELELLRLQKKDEPAEASERCRPATATTSCLLELAVAMTTSLCIFRSWQAESVDSGCSSSTVFTAACPEGLCAEGVCAAAGGRCDQTSSKPSKVKVRGRGGSLGVSPDVCTLTRASVCGLLSTGGEGHHD